MKCKIIPYFSIMLILLIPANTFADSVNISVDLPIFTDTDSIAIYGDVSTETTLQIIIIDQDEIILLKEDVMLTSGEFTYNIIVGNLDLKRSGHYDISITYDDTVITDQFFYDSEHNVNPMKVSSGIESLSESDETIIIISVLIFLARHSIFRKKTSMILVIGLQKKIETMKNIILNG